MLLWRVLHQARGMAAWACLSYRVAAGSACQIMYVLINAAQRTNTLFFAWTTWTCRTTIRAGQHTLREPSIPRQRPLGKRAHLHRFLGGFTKTVIHKLKTREQAVVQAA